PADLEFAKAMEKVALRVHLGLYEDETSRLCHWHVAQAHELESWSDARSLHGSITILQPLIAPLYDGRTAHELLAAFGEQPDKTRHDIVKDYWKGRLPAGSSDFETAWRTALHDGVVKDSAFRTKDVRVQSSQLAAHGSRPEGDKSEAGSLTILFRPDPTIWDGRYANNGWLQELPKPLTKLTWDNAAMIAPSTAEKLGVKTEDVVE